MATGIIFPAEPFCWLDFKEHVMHCSRCHSHLEDRGGFREAYLKGREGKFLNLFIFIKVNRV